MVNLKEKPYCLNDEQIQWVEDTIASMTVEEKIGQLFVNMVANEEERKPETSKKCWIHTIREQSGTTTRPKRSCGIWRTVCRKRQKSRS